MILTRLRTSSFLGLLQKPVFRVFLASLAIFLTSSTLWAQRADPIGDEPHYLLATYSLLADHDLDLANNYAERDYERFFRTEWYKPGDLDFIVREKHAFDYAGDGRLFSVHGAGLSAVLLPAYALAGRLGALYLMAFLTALLAALIYSLCRRYIGSGGLAALAWLPLALSIPVMPYAVLFFPEGIAALIITSGWILAFEKDRLKPRHFLVIALLVSVLPWFHVKYLAASAAILATCLVRRYREVSRAESLLSLSAPAILAGSLLGVFSSRVYGSPFPFAGLRSPRHRDAPGDAGRRPAGTLAG